MTTTITGFSDDLIEIEGDINEEFTAPAWKDDLESGVLTCSDGTALRFEYDKGGLWRFFPIFMGHLFVRVDQGNEETDTCDVVHFKDGLKWVAMSRSQEDFARV